MHRNTALAIVLLLAALFAPPRAKADATFTAILSGANEVPAPIASPASGFVTVTLTGNILAVNETFSNLTSPATASHIQFAPAGSNGPVAVAFTSFPAATSATYSMAFALTLDSTYTSTFLTASGGTAAGAEAALMADMFAGNTYINIHDATFPGGEIRGQLELLTPSATPYAPT